MGDETKRGAGLLERRAVVAGLAAAPVLAGRARAEDDDPTERRPQVGDNLVFLTGDKQGQKVRVEDLELGGAQQQAYPVDPSGVVRDGSRFNLILVVRVGEDGLSDETKARAVQGVVAYSAVCTHQACPVNMWSAELKCFVCSCHGSVYDPRNDAEVQAGPAPRALPALPLRVENGLLVVAGPFSSRVGGEQV